MVVAEASVSSPTPARYMGRLCKHFEHRVTVHREADRARIDFPDAPCTLLATNEQLLLRIEASNGELLGRLQEVVTRHLKQVASTEVFEVSWSSPMSG
jgi:hypothetical protein